MQQKKSSTSLKAVLFDHDGTLVESEDAHWQIWNTVLAPHGHRIELVDYQLRYAGFPTRANVEQAVQDFGLQVDVERFAREKIAATDAYQAAHTFPLMPHVQDILDWCAAQNLRMAVVTGANRSSLAGTFSAHGISSYFEATVCFEDVRRSKPSPDSYQAALQKMGLAAHECIALEDTNTGVRSAAAAGIPVIAIRNAWTQNQDFSLASHICENLLEAKAYLTTLI